MSELLSVQVLQEVLLHGRRRGSRSEQTPRELLVLNALLIPLSKGLAAEINKSIEHELNVAWMLRDFCAGFCSAVRHAASWALPRPCSSRVDSQCPRGPGVTQGKEGETAHCPAQHEQCASDGIRITIALGYQGPRHTRLPAEERCDLSAGDVVLMPGWVYLHSAELSWNWQCCCCSLVCVRAVMCGVVYIVG